MNILLISGVSANVSAGLGNSIITALTNKGHNVNFITKYKFENMNSMMYSVYDEYENTKRNVFSSIVVRCKRLLTSFKTLFFKNGKKRGKYIFIFDEQEMWVDSNLLLSKLPVVKYDLVLVLFWNNMVTARTLKDIFLKLQSPILFLVTDMLPITGGCYYFGQCQHYLETCGMCPAINSKELIDFTYYNLSYKKSVYSSINYYYGGNTWLREYGKRSPIIENERIKELFLPINENIFNIKNQNKVRRKLGLLESKKFVIFAGAADLEDERKGFKYLIDAINMFYDNLEQEMKTEVLFLLAGKTIPEKNLTFNMAVIQFGFVDNEVLAELYSASDIFICSSIDDAGPTMINQSIMCGTPVISFDIGVAQDIIFDGETGYKIPKENISEFSNKIRKFYDLKSTDRMRMRDRCRNVALEKYSLTAFADRVEVIYNEIQ